MKSRKIDLAENLIKTCFDFVPESYLFGGAVRNLVIAGKDNVPWEFKDLDIYLPNHGTLNQLSSVVSAICYSFRYYFFKDSFISQADNYYGSSDIRKINVCFSYMAGSLKDCFNVDFVSNVNTGRGPFYKDVDINRLKIKTGRLAWRTYTADDGLDVNTIINHITLRQFDPLDGSPQRISKMVNLGYKSLDDANYLASLGQVSNQKVVAVKKEKKCVCGKMNDEDVNECWNCGRLV